MSVPFTKAYSALHWAWATRSKSNTPGLNELITVYILTLITSLNKTTDAEKEFSIFIFTQVDQYGIYSNLDNFTQQDHWCRTERNFSIFIFTQVDQYGMRAIDQNPVKATHTWSRTHHKEHETIPNPCHCTFTGQSIFSLNLRWIPTPIWTCVTNHRHRHNFKLTLSFQRKLKMGPLCGTVRWSMLKFNFHCKTFSC